MKELPVVYEEGDVEVDEEMDVEVDKEDVEEMIEQQGCSGDTNEGSYTGIWWQKIMLN